MFILYEVLRALSICQNWLARPFPWQWESHFFSKLSSQINQSLNSMYEGFHQELLEKAYFNCQNDWSGRESFAIQCLIKYLYQ